jgi:hypothetical protein
MVWVGMSRGQFVVGRNVKVPVIRGSMGGVGCGTGFAQRVGCGTGFAQRVGYGTGFAQRVGCGTGFAQNS